jgi:hypothetical protein
MDAVADLSDGVKKRVKRPRRSRAVTVCSFQTSSEHSTSLGRVRYQHCICGRFRVLLDSDVVKEGPCDPAADTRIPAALLTPQLSAMTVDRA